MDIRPCPMGKTRRSTCCVPMKRRVPAVEITTSIGQTLMHLGAGLAPAVPQSMTMAETAAYVADRRGLFIADHPNWRYRPDRPHATAEELLQAGPLGAIEIYTGVIERLPGSPYATDVWDVLLSAGRRVFGHATDDQHREVDRFLGWNCVQWPDGADPTADAVIDALRAGRFYASTGVQIHNIWLEAGTGIRIDSDAEEIRWYVKGGMLADVQEGGGGRFDIAGMAALPRLQSPDHPIASPLDAVYVRAECVGGRGRRAWSQPFFIEPA